jgi:hypothetical protein
MRNDDFARILQESLDLRAHFGPAFLAVDPHPVPLQRLFLGVDHEAARRGIKVGLVGRDPEIEGDGGQIGVRQHPAPFGPVAVTPHVRQVVRSQNARERRLELLGDLIHEAAVEAAGHGSGNEAGRIVRKSSK